MVHVQECLGNHNHPCLFPAHRVSARMRPRAGRQGQRLRTRRTLLSLTLLPKPETRSSGTLRSHTSDTASSVPPDSHEAGFALTL